MAPIVLAFLFANEYFRDPQDWHPYARALREQGEWA